MANDVYDFPPALAHELRAKEGSLIEVMRGDKAWVAVAVDGVSDHRYASGSGPSLDTALDDLADGLPAQPEESAESVPLASLRHLESVFTGEGVVLRLSVATEREFHAELVDPKTGEDQHQRQHGTAATPAQALTALAALFGSDD